MPQGFASELISNSNSSGEALNLLQNIKKGSNGLNSDSLGSQEYKVGGVNYGGGENTREILMQGTSNLLETSLSKLFD